MTKRKPPESSEELVSAFADLFNEVEPETSEEIDAVLHEAGYDPDEVASRMRAVAQQAIAESPLNWRNRVDELQEERDRLASFSPPLVLPREDLLKEIQSILGRIASGQARTIMAYYRNLDEVTNEDLASLLVDLQYLDSQQRKRPEQDDPS